MLSDMLKPYAYRWPYEELSTAIGGQFIKDKQNYILNMPEKVEDISKDSRWPVFFPSAISLVTTGDSSKTALEKVVGASIVNRFPYILALNFCKKELSKRHHGRKSFMEALENNGSAAIQFIPPGSVLDKVMTVISTIPENEMHKRIQQTQLPVRKAEMNPAPVFEASYMVYEARLVKPGKDFDGNPIYTHPWIDIGSHRVYFMEINAIQLRQDIAEGRSQVLWRSLPAWEPEFQKAAPAHKIMDIPHDGSYMKKFNPYYKFPAENTVAFEADEVKGNMSIKYLPPLPEDQVEVDNDRARWPCFFPSSLVMITSWSKTGEANLMPCGSTFVASRYPMVIATCISYAGINERYAPRATLNFIRKSGKFGCGVPFINDLVLNAINYSGNVSMRKDPLKMVHSGLSFEGRDLCPVLTDLPIHFSCMVIDEVKLGTHTMFLGEVEQIQVRSDVTPDNSIEWCPWVDILGNSR